MINGENNHGLQNVSEDSFKVLIMTPISCLVNFLHMQLIIKVLIFFCNKIQSFEIFYMETCNRLYVFHWKTWKKSQVREMLVLSTFFTGWKREFGDDVQVLCMFCVGLGGEKGNRLDDYGLNLLVSSDLVNWGWVCTDTNEWNYVSRLHLKINITTWFPSVIMTANPDDGNVSVRIWTERENRRAPCYCRAQVIYGCITGYSSCTQCRPVIPGHGSADKCIAAMPCALDWKSDT